MAMKLKVLALILLLIFIFPQKARAGEREFIARFRTDDGMSMLTYEELDFIGVFSEKERAWVVFHNLLCSGKSEFVPQGVRLLSVNIVGGELIVNVSDQIRNYGGIYNEKHLRAQIVLTGLELRSADTVTLLINGEPAVLPEGSTINRVSEWDELM